MVLRNSDDGQDFGSLYYLLELCPGDDLYSAMLENDRPVGAHRYVASYITDKFSIAR